MGHMPVHTFKSLGRKETKYKIVNFSHYKIKSTFKPDESINSINDGIYGSKENIANTFLNEL